MISFSDQKTKYFLWGGVLTLYFVTHLLGLLNLPVFADEAIYIRWSQLILDDWQRYLFFALNDGKTPLFIWLLTPFVKVFQNPLWAGRVLSVLIGAGQLVITQKIIASLGGKRIAQMFGVAVVTLLPFWVFFHRMALIDGLLTLFISLTVYGLIQLSKLKLSHFLQREVILWTVFTGIGFGLALLTKLPAIFFLPIFPLYAYLSDKKFRLFSSIIWRKLILIGIAGFIGLFIFGLLKLHPAFGQLFSRGQDFTFTPSELLAGEWRASISNLGKVIFWQGSYLSFSLTALTLLSAGFSQSKKKYVILLLSLIISTLPFIVFARVFSPRYILPIALFTTVVSSLFFEELFLELPKKRWITYVIVLPPIFITARFFMSAWFHINSLPLVPIDREQYLEEWSAGQGNYEMSLIIAEKAKHGRVVVATEGYFGTLPDGLLMYFHNQNVENIEIFGVGQPIREMPNELLEKAETADTAYLLVNTHRMLISDPRLKLVHKFPRPGQSSSLDVYEFDKNIVIETE